MYLSPQTTVSLPSSTRNSKYLKSSGFFLLFRLYVSSLDWDDLLGMSEQSWSATPHWHVSHVFREEVHRTRSRWEARTNELDATIDIDSSIIIGRSNLLLLNTTFPSFQLLWGHIIAMLAEQLAF
jgi:hypothetical protein